MNDPAGRIPQITSGSRLNDLLKRGTTLRHAVVGKSMIVVGAVILTMLVVQQLTNGAAPTPKDLAFTAISAFVIMASVAGVLNLMLTRVTAPLEELTTAMLKLAQGDLTVQTPCL